MRRLAFSSLSVLIAASNLAGQTGVVKSGTQPNIWWSGVVAQMAATSASEPKPTIQTGRSRSVRGEVCIPSARFLDPPMSCRPDLIELTINGNA